MFNFSIYSKNHIGSIMVSLLDSSVVDPRSVQTKYYIMGICCFSTKHAAISTTSKQWLVRNQANVSNWGDMSIRGMLFQWASTINIQLSVLVLYIADLIIISLKINLLSPWYSWKIAELALHYISLTPLDEDVCIWFILLNVQFLFSIYFTS